MGKHFTLEYWSTDDWYIGKLKEAPGVFSQGKTLSELEDNIREVYDLMLEDEDEFVPHAEVYTKELEVAV